MIFYTLQGPQYKIEIHDDKIKLIRKGIWGWMSKGMSEYSFPLHDLTKFQVTVPKMFGYSKVECCTQSGKKITFRLSTNSHMMIKIERYLQKVILKNLNHNVNHTEQVPFEQAA